MTLQTRTPIRSCGKQYRSEEEALSSKRGLTGEYLANDCPACGAVHLERKTASRDTGPEASARPIVLERDGHACVSCGKPVGRPGQWWSIQHRLARGQGGGNELSNLIALCGSATSPGCHRRCEDREQEMNDRGYWLRSDQDPHLVGVLYLSASGGSGFTAWLEDDGSLLFEPPQGAV